MKKSTIKIKHVVLALVVSAFGSIGKTNAQKEIAPEVIQMSPPISVNFQQLADYELTHPVKHKKRFIEQGEDREKNGGFIPQPVLPNAVVTPIQAPPQQGPGINIMSAAPTLSFNGTLDNGSLIPPDIRGAAGDNHIMETTNQEFKIYSKAGVLNSTLSITTFFTGSGGSGFFDPHIIYDKNNSRWVICIDGNLSNNHSALFIAVSQTNNPTGSWWIYNVDATGNTSDFMDYPLLGLNTNWVVVTGRNFLSSGTVKANVFVWNRATVYAGTATTATKFTDATNSLTLAPAHTYDNGQTTEYIVCNSNGNSGGNGFVRLSTVTGTPAAPVYTVGAQLGVAFPWNDNSGITTGASQSGTTTKIESGDTRIGNAVYTNGSLWFSHTAYLPATSPTRSAVDWWQVDPATSTVQQFGRIDSAVAGGFNFYSSIAVNPAGDVFIGYCHSSSNMFPSSAYSFHASTDASGTSQSMYIYKNGLASYNKTFGSGRNRYGDYTGSALDPVNNSFWNFSEWAQTGNNWGTVIANVAATPGNVLSAITTTSISPLSYCAGATLNVAFTTTGTANVGNIFTAQLSNSSGSFASPVSIGTLTGTTAGTIACIIPIGATAGSGYRIRVVSSTPVVTGTDNGSNITINALPVSSITGDNGACASSVGQLCSASSFSGYQWSIGETTQCISVNATGNYKLTVTDANGCTSSSSKQFTSFSLPNLTTSPAATSLCKGDSVTLGVSGAATYSWAPTTGLSSAVGASVKSSPASAIVYTVTGTNANGCTNTASVSLTVKSLPTLAVSPASTNICPGNSVNINSSGTSISYVWTPSTGLNVTTGSSVTASPTSTTLYSVTGTGNNGCKRLKTSNVIVSCPKPTSFLVSSLTKNSAQLNWNKIACAVSYKFQYRKNGVTTWTTINTVVDTFRVLTGLLTSTTYDYRVATRCSNGAVGGYSAISQFTTLALRAGEIAQIEKSNEFEMEAFPNPTKSEINITLNNIEDGSAEILIYDALGNTVFKKQIVITDGEYNEPLNMNSYKAGIYVLQLVKNGNIKNVKIVKE